MSNSAGSVLIQIRTLPKTAKSLAETTLANARRLTTVYHAVLQKKTQLPGWWGRVVNILTVAFGWVLVSLIYANPGWTGSREAWVAVLLVIVIPVGLATRLVLFRLISSPFWFIETYSRARPRDYEAQHRAR